MGQVPEVDSRGFPSDSPRSFALPAAVLPLQRKKAELPCAVVLPKRAAGISGDPIPTLHLSAHLRIQKSYKFNFRTFVQSEMLI